MYTPVVDDLPTVLVCFCVCSYIYALSSSKPFTVGSRLHQYHMMGAAKANDEMKIVIM